MKHIISLLIAIALVGVTHAVTCDSFVAEEACTGKLTDVGACVWNAGTSTCVSDGKGLPVGMVGVTSVENGEADQALEPISLKPTEETADRVAEGLPTNGTFCTQPPMGENMAGIQCTGYFPSWFYNKTTDTCEEFVYGGCGATLNLFSTEKDCTTSVEKFCRTEANEDDGPSPELDPSRMAIVEDTVGVASGAYAVTAFSGLLLVGIRALAH